jgi:hypothetical protein
MVVAYDAEFPADRIYLRPDLIALPSAVSFVPGADSEPEVVALLSKRSGTPALLEINEGAGTRETDCNVALAAEAIRNVAGDGIYYSPVSLISRITVPHDNQVLIDIRGRFGKNAKLSLGKDEHRLIFNGDLPWEAEVSLAIDAQGQPGMVFLEKSSGNKKVDSELVHALSRAASWSGVNPGYGRVLISYSPPKNNGTGK